MHFSTASILGALFTATVFQPFVNGQLYGSILQSGEDGSGMVQITVENNSTKNFSVEARNNLFDPDSPYQPMNITNLAGQQLTLVGAQYTYGLLDDASFVSIPAGAVWTRKLNLTAYMPADLTTMKPTASCYYVTFPDGFWAIDTTDMVPGTRLATEYLAQGSSRLVDLYVTSNILHINITVMPGTTSTPVATTAAIPQQAKATEFVGTQVIEIAASNTWGSSVDQYDNILGA